MYVSPKVERGLHALHAGSGRLRPVSRLEDVGAVHRLGVHHGAVFGCAGEQPSDRSAGALPGRNH